jgi:hypothetical protein
VPARRSRLHKVNQRPDMFSDCRDQAHVPLAPSFADALPFSVGSDRVRGHLSER